MIRVAIADDSAFTCRLLTSYVEGAGDCEVVAVAHDARSTVDAVLTAAPDVLTLDLSMPGVDGLDLLRHLAPMVAIVVISGVTRGAAAMTLRALESGAVDFVLKFTPGVPVSAASLRREIIAKVKVAAASHRLRRSRAAHRAADLGRRGHPAHRRIRPIRTDPVEAIVIGASTGGPRAVSDVLARLPENFAAPCVVLQHLPPLFSGPFAAQLARRVRVPVREAAADDTLQPGTIVVAAGTAHLEFGPRGRLALRPPTSDDVHRPSIDRAMTSAAEQFGVAAVGVVLTGMGGDGAEGLRAIRARGGDGYVQDPDSCVVASMPLRALDRAGADYVASPEHLGDRLAARGKP